MTFEEAHKKLLSELDEAYQELVKIHQDLTHLNPGSEEFIRAGEVFNSVQVDIFNLKGVWDNVKHSR